MDFSDHMDAELAKHLAEQRHAAEDYAGEGFPLAARLCFEHATKIEAELSLRESKGEVEG